MAVLTQETAMERLRQMYREKRLIPFIGAGFSIPLGLPSWEELIGWVARELGFEPELYLLQGDYEQLAGYLEARLGRSGLLELIAQLRLQFQSERADERRRRSQQHQALAQLEWHTIYTTNYEHHIEEALRDQGKTAVSLADAGDFVEHVDKSDCKVIKFHGDLAPGKEDTIVLTEEKYFERFSLESAVDQRLRSDLLSNSFLFMGYSFNDPNIRFIWHRMNQMLHRLRHQPGGPAKRSYLTAFGAGLVQPTLLERWNIDVIELDPVDKPASITSLLNALQE